MLTKKQRELLILIHESMAEDGIPPSYEEMKDFLGLKSKSGIHRLISALEERGYIARLPHRARALEIKRLPEGYHPKTSKNASEVINATIKSSSAISFDEVPLYGRIAAGTPIEAIRDEGTTLPLPPGFTGTGEHYALTIDGDSMINVGIHDQDTVVIKRVDSAENGTIIVALVDDSEVTLKRLRRAGGKIVLEPENDSYEPRILDPHRVKIQGTLVSLLRRYH